ncbi:MAG: sigma-54-dependent Fis family transcriptional regulator [Deltaproteobacteria bacterium]|nr:sigma-54-dependent Fis family transcriptional regulator [Deltaproteobacteria bacterium]
MTSTARILVVDDEASLRQMMDVLLRRQGHEVVLAEGVREAKDILESAPVPFDLVVTDLMMADGIGLEVLDKARALSLDTQVLLVTAHGSVDTAVEAMRRGAYGYLEKPLSVAAARAVVEKALEKRALLHDNRSLRKQARALTPDEGQALIGQSAAFRAALEFVRRAAPTRASVLVTGESGTGKELFARAVHQGSDRAEGPFVVVNCGAIPENLMESEFFGHDKGAFTGADRRRDGMFKVASGGTLFLDEVGEIPVTLQVKLLRALQDRKVRPVGSNTELPVDVRIVAATNRDLARMVREKTFREDLYYRLNVLRLHLPPLRERPEDVPTLVEYFRRRYAEEEGRPMLGFSPEAMRSLLAYSYPGNVRQLENAIQRAVTLAQGATIQVDDLPPELLGAEASTQEVFALPPEGLDLEATLARVERSLLRQALERSNGVRTRAAQLLRLTFRSFRYRLAKLGLSSDPEGEADGEGGG